MKTKFLSILLAAVLLLTTAAFARPSALAADADPADVDTQIIPVKKVILVIL